MSGWAHAVRSAVPGGMLAGVATSSAAALGGRQQTGSAVAALNAPSHIVHSEDAARVERPTAGHTLVGLLVNTAATLFWATVFEKALDNIQGRHKPSAIWAAAAGTAAAAYVTDYHLVPRKLRPGYERRATGPALLGIYAALALSLGVAALMRRG